MMTEEWLSSTLRLCQLTTDPYSAPPDDWNAEEVVINTHTYPKCDYDHSSVFVALKAYTDTLHEAWGRRTNQNKHHGRQNILDPNHLQTDIVDRYAETLCADIVGVALRGRGTEDVMVHRPDNTHNSQAEEIKLTMSCQERQAERLASEIYSRALEELGVLSNVVLPKQMDQTDSISEVRSEPTPFLWSSTRQPANTTGDHDRTHSPGSKDRPDYDPGSRVRTSGSTTCCGMLNGIAPTGSLDYPDAPPSTPLLPGMTKSRDSFSRKLKGGLAKEFMPSPPPPTPKDPQAGSLQEDRMAEAAADGSDFVIRLMRSLSLACAQCRDLDEEERGAKDRGGAEAGTAVLSEYAGGLSADIIHGITSTQTCVNIKEEIPVRDVHSLASHLAEEITLMSIAEVVWCKGLDGKTQQKSSSLYETETQDRTQVFSNALMPRSGPDVPAVEILRALSDKLVANALLHAFSELGVDGLQYSLRLLGAGSESMRSGAGSNHCPNSSLDTTTCHRITALNLGACDSEPDCSTDDARGVKLTAERSFAESIVDEALQRSMQEHCLSNGTICDHSRLSASVLPLRTAGHAVVKGVVSETRCGDLQDPHELQCVLLWAAASHLGTSVLRLQLPEGHVQQQLCSLSLRTQFHGWTVGDLMESVLQYCEDLQAASRGHCKSSGSLLGHLLLCVD